MEMSHPEQDPITVKAAMPVAILDINQRPAGVGPSQIYLHPNLAKIRLLQISMPLFIPYFLRFLFLLPQFSLGNIQYSLLSSSVLLYLLFFSFNGLFKSDSSLNTNESCQIQK